MDWRKSTHSEGNGGSCVETASSDGTIQVRDTDRYRRTVADVILPDGRSLNREMVREGMAWWYRQYAPNDTELERLEAEGLRSVHRWKYVLLGTDHRKVQMA